MHDRPTQGFTLIEVMIVVAIVGILAAIALPAYTQYIMRGRITDAVTALASMESRMEQYFQDNRTYVGACQANTIAALPTLTYFTLACPGATATNYTITATGTGAMNGFTYTMAYGGGTLTKATAVPAGWTSAGTCWVLKQDGSC